MGTSKKKKVIDFFRYLAALIGFIFAVYTVFYRMENPELTETQIFQKFCGYYFIWIIVFTGLEGLSNRVKE